MKKFFKWAHENALFLITIFLLAFIPLYPKLPLVDVKNTWVYIRAEDFIVFLVLLVYVYFIIKKKITLNTPLTIPILAFWILGGIATIHGVLLFFPSIANIFPNVALLSYVRHIEYMSVFFVAFAGMRKKEFLKPILVVISAVFVVTCLYGLGQKYASFPAFLTMNEEFAKGIPITLSKLSRVPSTFAGHYDFAAYLVLLTPVFVALFFGVRNVFIKVFFAGAAALGLLLMFMTVSRVSFFAVMLSIGFVLFILKRKLVLFSLPVILILGILVTFTQSSLFARFGNTISETDVLVNGKTGAAIGNVEYVPVTYLYGKTVKVQRVDDDEKLGKAISGNVEETTTSGLLKPVLPYELLPANALVPLVKASNISNGETLPQGTGYINLSLSPVKTRVGDFYYELSPNISENEVVNFHGNFLVKSASAYDLSFTTRFQGEWPNAMVAFMRNIFFGTGYGSVSLAIDNNFLRMLAEVGILGTGAFILLLISVGIYTYKTYKYIESKLVKTFAVGVCAGIIGLSINAVLIDVFEASKVAFILWLLIGITLAALTLESSKKLHLKSELLAFAVSPFALVSYLLVFCLFLYTSIVDQFFTLNDFNVFYHSISCGIPTQCFSVSSISNYFLGMNGAEPPLVTLYFSTMYKFFWLNQVMYHSVSIALNFIMALTVFMFTKKILKRTIIAGFAGFLFLVSASTFQSTSSVSLIGIVASSLFTFLSLACYAYGYSKKNLTFYLISTIASCAAVLFGATGVIIPLLILSYTLLIERKKLVDIISSVYFWIVSIPSLTYMLFQVIGAFTHRSNPDMPGIEFGSIVLVNTVMSIPSVILGESMNSITIKLYDVPLIIQLVFSMMIVISVIAFCIISLKRKFFKSGIFRLFTFLIIFFVLALLPFSIYKDVFIQNTYFAVCAWCIILSLIISGAYTYLRQNGTVIALGFVSVGIITYSLFQIIQVQAIYKNNHTSSDSVKKFLVSIDSLYSNTWAQGKVDFYFLNTPSDFLQSTRSQSSLESVLWLVFKNPELSVHISDNLDSALQNANKQSSSHVFIFNDDRTISEIPKYMHENE